MTKMKHYYPFWIFATFIITVCFFFFCRLRWFSVSCESMMPTCVPGDTLFIDTSSLSRELHVLHFKYGDIMVFMLQPYFFNNAAARVVGKPGDFIQIKEGVLHINRMPVQLSPLEDYVVTDKNGQIQRFSQYMETLPNGTQHKIIVQKNLYETTKEYSVDEDHYFVLADNRDTSKDSRNPEIGMIQNSKYNRKSIEILSKN